MVLGAMTCAESVYKRVALSDQTEELSNDHLLQFFVLLDVQDLCRCALVSRRWNGVVMSDACDKTAWKTAALRKVLGKRVWEENVHVDVGVEPCYRIGGHAISWREVCKIQRQPSFFKAALTIKMIEVDFLVPKTLNGKPTTINRVIEVFAKAKKPVGFMQTWRQEPELFIKYGDIPIEESYFARITFTVDHDTRHEQPERRVEIIQEKGQRFYRLHHWIEKIIYTFLAYQVSAPYAYISVSADDELWKLSAFSQCSEIYDDGSPVICGSFEEPAPGKQDGGLKSYHSASVGSLYGAGALREF